MKWVKFVNILNLAIMSGFSFFPLPRFTTDYARFRSVFFVHGLSLNVLLRYYIQTNGITVMGRIRIFSEHAIQSLGSERYVRGERYGLNE